MRSPEFLEKKIDSLQRSIDSYNKRIEEFKKELENSRAIYKEFKYKQGQAVYSKSYGNCLIRKKSIKGSERTYEVITVEGNTYFISEKYLIPVSQATEILLNNKKVGEDVSST